jgi:hypothetical protein
MNGLSSRRRQFLAAIVFALAGAAPYTRRESGLAFRNMARIYTAALALEGYLVDNGRYPSLDSPQAFRAVCGPYFPSDPSGENWSPSVSVQVTPQRRSRVRERLVRESVSVNGSGREGRTSVGG